MSTKQEAGPKILRPTKIQWPILALIVLVVVAAGYALVRMTLAASGTLTVVSTGSTVSYGNNVTVAVRVNGGTDPINAVQADLTYPTNTLQFVSIDTTGSAFPVAAQTTGGSGVVTIAVGTQGGAAPVTGDALVANITFKAIGTGSATIGVSNTSLGLRPSDSTNVIVGYTGKTLSVIDTVAPSVPTGVVKTASTLTSVSLTWTASTDDISVAGYRVYRGGTQVGTPAGNTFTDTGLSPGTSYNYTVAAIDAAGNLSGQSTPVTLATNADVTPPATPAAPTVSSRTLTSITLGWTATTDDVGVVNYKVFRGTVQVGSVAGLTFTDTSLTPGTSYAYQITASDAAGNTSAKSAVANLSTLPDTTAPSIPTPLAFVSQGNGVVNLSWAAATDNVAVTGYRIYRAGVVVNTVSGTTGSAALPAAAGAYNYTVAAVDAAGNVSAQSNTITVNVYGAADINKDGHVNVQDLSMLLTGWNKPGATDVNGDGNTTIVDLSLLLSAWTG